MATATWMNAIWSPRRQRGNGPWYLRFALLSAAIVSCAALDDPSWISSFSGKRSVAFVPVSTGRSVVSFKGTMGRTTTTSALKRPAQIGSLCWRQACAPRMTASTSGDTDDEEGRLPVLATVGAAGSTLGGVTVDARPSGEQETGGSSSSTSDSSHRAAVVAVEKAVKSLPGTWWASGLPKWVHTFRRRMITKEDFLHLHAASGAIYTIGGTVWLLSVLVTELFGGTPHLDTNSLTPLLLLGAGLTNVLTSIPMANTRSWVLSGLFVSILQLWLAWHVSGAYPASLAPADPWLAAGSLSLLIISAVEAEETIASESKARELVRSSGRRWKPTGKVIMRNDDYVQGDAVQRYGALANFFFNAPHLYATLVGSGWVERLAETYPMAPALLFHAYFALASATSLALLAPTLYSRKLIDAQGLSMMQALTVAPVVMSAIDSHVMGAAATNNPVEIYLGFLH